MSEYFFSLLVLLPVVTWVFGFGLILIDGILRLFRRDRSIEKLRPSRCPSC